MQLFHFLGFAPLRKSNINHEWDITSASLLQAALFPWTHSAASFLHGLILFLPPTKTGFLKNITHRHIFSCCESLQCCGSNPPAGLTRFGGRGEVELSQTPEQRHQIPNLRNLSVCLLCCPSPALLSSLSHSSSCLFYISSQADSQPNILGGQGSVIYP